MQFELSNGLRGYDIDRGRKKQQEFMTWFKDPLNNHYFIPLQKETFTSVICGWIVVAIKLKCTVDGRRI